MSKLLNMLPGILCCVLSAPFLSAQTTATARVEIPPEHRPEHNSSAPPAVLWLEPVGETHLPPPAGGPYIMRQKKRDFVPHVLVVPVGAAVTFPNDDPFFHNVFSLYNGKRFDLGLYESGTSKQVVFNREGVSYLFCNIHPEMSAVIVALSTPWWAQADRTGALRISNVPPGEYNAHLWVEGADPTRLNAWTHRVVLTSGTQSVGTLSLPPAAQKQHMNKFGKPYMTETPVY